MRSNNKLTPRRNCHLRTFALLAALLLGTSLPLKAQGDYDMESGFYYLENKQNNEGYFLVPAGGSGTMKYFNNDANTPYLTTYKKSKETTDEAINNFIWYVEKVSTGIYRLRHMLTGRYVVINGVVDNNNPAHRRFHLETQQVPDDYTTQFLFFKRSSTDSRIGIRHASIYAQQDASKQYWWMEVSGGNQDNYSQGDYKGLVGLWEVLNENKGREKWTQPAAIDSSKKVCLPPVISYNSSTQEVTISSYEGATDVDFYYTTDGSDPTTSSTHYTVPFTLATGTVKAIAVRDNTFQNPTVTIYNTQQCATPTITFNSNTGKYGLSCSTSDVTYYYTTDGTIPISTSTSTTDSITLPLDLDGEQLRVVAARTAGDFSDVSVPVTVAIPLCATPTITMTIEGSNANISMSCETVNATIRYNNNSNVPTSTTGTVYSAHIQKNINSAPSTHTARAFRQGYRRSSSTTYDYSKLATPAITGVNANGSLTLTPAGATFRYTTSKTATLPSNPGSGQPELVPSTTVVLPAGTDVTVVKVRGYKLGNGYSDVLTYYVPTLQEPTITESDGNITISGETGVTIYYTTDGTDPTTSSNQYTAPFAKGSATVIRAYASKAGYHDSFIATLQDAVEVNSTNLITNMTGSYKLAEGFTIDGSIGTATAPFRGTIDGQNNRIASSMYPLVAYAQDAEIKNILLTTATVSGDTVGAICNIATGHTRIYNCGLQGGTVTGNDIAGGLVGFINGNARVINCYSYANVSSGNYAAGIVGYNNYATTSVLTNLKTMVMNCMFYGDITAGNNKSPIYGGKSISNAGDNGVGNYNYFRLEAPYVSPTATITYNCALGAEDRFLQRFEFYRHLLNSHRELAGWWATDSYDKEPMYKWVLHPDSIGTSHPYPILMPFGKYPSVVNIDAEHATTQTERNKGGKLGTLSVKIQMGDGAVYQRPSGAQITTSQLNLNITDKDPDHFNFNYYKVQLPYYNDVGTKNYNGNRVVTGWKIVSIIGGTPGTFTASDSWGGYNFADRNCTNKDLYGTSGRVFNQGAYWDVPEGVTEITIEPYWAKCVYLADPNADKVYNAAMETGYDVPNVGGGLIYTNGNSYSIAGESQVVYTTMGNAISSTNSTGLFVGIVGDANNHSVYDYAVVLVGNYHHFNSIEASKAKPYTVTSIDLDGDNEPDYSYMLRFNGRTECHPVRTDFINIPGLGMAQKSTGGTGSYNFGIMIPKGWFEGTNTSLFRFTQFEYENQTRSETDALILQGGVMEQWVSYNQKGRSNKIPYIHVGGNVWFKEFHTGCHQDKNQTSGSNRFQPTKHSPISVTGGDFDEFYLTGLYVANANLDNYADNAECYINGGRFGTVCGAAMEGIGKANGADNTGNISWLIQNADIREFYAGGLNAAKPVTGNLSTTIIDSHVDIFCGGPKFGDMSANKTVTTTATGCTIGTFFGAGYGGNSYSRYAPSNQNNVTNISWNTWVSGQYTQAYNGTYGGVSTQFNYQFLPMSDNKTNVARIFVEFVKFSLATTHGVTSNLKHCTVTDNFYGGGSLGKVEGNVTSILDSCTVQGNVFGAGFSASLPNVEADSIGFRVEPYYYDALGTYRTAIKGQTTTYTWAHGNTISIDNTNHILYTTEDLTTLGNVKGNVNLTIKGNSVIGTQGVASTGSVYGGGDESAVTGASNKITVTLQGTTQVMGNVFGGGNEGLVEGSTEVNIE